LYGGVRGRCCNAPLYSIKKLNKKGKQKITIQFLQTEYIGAATNWFSGKYGLEKTPEHINKNNNLK